MKEIKKGKRYRSCTKKSRYPTMNDALKYAKRRSRESGQELDAYYCELCDGYHITKKMSYNPYT